jgi:serine/threonine protein kinase
MQMGACTTPPNLCIVSEYVSQGSLFKILHKNKEGPLSMERKIRIALDTAKGIHYLHTCRPPIIHGDLKSPNLLLDRNDVVKVCDFGLSRVKVASKLSVASKMGTPEWTAPEVLKSESCSEASDAYSFGVVLWEILTGRVPWADKTPMQVVLSVGLQHERLPIPKDASIRLQGLLTGCFGNPEARPNFDQIIHTLKVELREVRRNTEGTEKTANIAI